MKISLVHTLILGLDDYSKNLQFRLLIKGCLGQRKDKERRSKDEGGKMKRKKV